MSTNVSSFSGRIFAIVATLGIAVAGNAVAASYGGRSHMVAAGGFHGGYAGGYHGGAWAGHAYSGWHGYAGWRGYYGGWHGYYGGYYGPWRVGWGWAGWGCCGWGWPAVSVGWYPTWYGPLEYVPVQYEVVQSPVGNTPVSPPTGRSSSNKWTDLFAYPKAGQSAEQQARDRAECHDWAVSQTGFDPAQPSHDDPKDWATKRESYLRAEGACLVARNYSVK